MLVCGQLVELLVVKFLDRWSKEELEDLEEWMQHPSMLAPALESPAVLMLQGIDCSPIPVEIQGLGDTLHAPCLGYLEIYQGDLFFRPERYL